MEALFVIGFFVLIYWLSNKSDSSTPTRSSTSQGYFGPPQLKIVSETLEDSELIVKKLMFRGTLPVNRTMNLSYAISAFDVTEGSDSAEAIISMIEAVQEPDNVCFSMSNSLGSTSVGDTFAKWVQLGAAVPELLQPPRSGKRKIRLLLRIFNTNNAPNIRFGFTDGAGETIFVGSVEFDYNFTEKGFEEAVEHREESQAIALKIGVAVAMSDGHLDDSEGQLLKDWIIKEIAPFDDEKQNRLKSLFNNALKEAFSDAKIGNLALSPLVDRLAEIGDKKSKYEAVDLCFDVMAADGQADPEEMKVIRKVAEALDLDMDEIEHMREKVTLNLSTELSGEDGLESLVGLQADWSSEEKKKHLRKEFQKWSNRINALEEGEERQSAQNMLDSIAKLRKKYG